MIERELRANPEWSEVGGKAIREKQADGDPAPPANDDGLDALKRDELNTKAAELGIEDPDKLGNKAAVVAAIREKQADG
jgi:hypothetical protein